MPCAQAFVPLRDETLGMTRKRVVIVGGGIAGVSLGSELALDHDVILLEAEPSLGVHSTGRSAALFMAGYGPAPVRELTRRSESEFIRLSSLPGIPNLLTPRGGLFTAWDESSAAALMSMTASQPSMAAVTSERALELCPVLRTDNVVMCAYDPNTRDIDVHALHTYYAATLRRRRGQIVTRARLVEVTRRAPTADRSPTGSPLLATPTSASTAKASRTGRRPASPPNPPDVRPASARGKDRARNPTFPRQPLTRDSMASEVEVRPADPEGNEFCVLRSESDRAAMNS